MFFFPSTMKGKLRTINNDWVNKMVHDKQINIQKKIVFSIPI